MEKIYVAKWNNILLCNSFSLGSLNTVQDEKALKFIFRYERTGAAGAVEDWKNFISFYDRLTFSRKLNDANSAALSLQEEINTLNQELVEFQIDNLTNAFFYMMLVMNKSFIEKSEADVSLPDVSLPDVVRKTLQRQIGDKLLINDVIQSILLKLLEDGMPEIEVFLSNMFRNVDMAASSEEKWMIRQLRVELDKQSPNDKLRNTIRKLKENYYSKSKKTDAEMRKIVKQATLISLEVLKGNIARKLSIHITSRADESSAVVETDKDFISFLYEMLLNRFKKFSGPSGGNGSFVPLYSKQDWSKLANKYNSDKAELEEKRNSLKIQLVQGIVAPSDDTFYYKSETFQRAINWWQYFKVQSIKYRDFEQTKTPSKPIPPPVEASATFKRRRTTMGGAFLIPKSLGERFEITSDPQTYTRNMFAVQRLLFTDGLKIRINEDLADQEKERHVIPDNLAEEWQNRKIEIQNSILLIEANASSRKKAIAKGNLKQSAQAIVRAWIGRLEKQGELLQSQLELNIAEQHRTEDLLDRAWTYTNNISNLRAKRDAIPFKVQKYEVFKHPYPDLSLVLRYNSDNADDYKKYVIAKKEHTDKIFSWFLEHILTSSINSGKGKINFEKVQENIQSALRLSFMARTLRNINKMTKSSFFQESKLDENLSFITDVFDNLNFLDASILDADFLDGFFMQQRDQKNEYFTDAALHRVRKFISHV